MNIEKIETEWAKDSKIDLTDLSKDSSLSLEMHQKYFRIINHAKKRLRELEAEKKRMLLIKGDYYTGNLAKEEYAERNWKPFKRTVLKTDLDKWIDADEDIITLNTEIGNYHDIITFCESIIKSIQNKPFIIKNIIENNKFLNGGY